ncbi:SLC13 family permease [Solicola gregarius]|uniref:Arsenic transporter n=1 Tax=Solicola gregarius TaxID=2908642 RepID=A0AA46TJF4_9ACTN|nr:SLC13 family permease [Solicola gregarius]UYM05588.1 arsenic transporter [Solicola gregarius]
MHSPSREESALADAIAVAALAATVLTAIRWPRPGAEIATGSVAAAAVLLCGAVSPSDAGAQVRDLAPVVGFLIALLVLGAACSAAGLFEAVGGVLSRAAWARPGLALPLAASAAALTSVALSLDTTVVLLTPALAIAARRIGQAGRPYEFLSVRMANSASLLLPVSNLTNLLALAASGLGYLEWAWLMLPVWVCVIVLETGVVRLTFGRAVDPDRLPSTPPAPPDEARTRMARAAGIVVGLVLVGFAAGSYAGVEPVWIASVGAVVLAIAVVRRRPVTARSLLASAGLPFAYFVLCWGIVVAAVAQTGVVRELERHLPAGDGLGSLVALALIAMLAANLLNNLPATLLLTPLVAPAGPVAVLAVLVGVNVGSNLSYAGSLANLLWRKVVRRLHDDDPTRAFHLLGALTTPALVVVCTTVLWAWTSLVR